MFKRLQWCVCMGYVMHRSTMLQGTWKEKRITRGLDARWESEIRIIIFGSWDLFFALGSVRECNYLGK
jgi:hypothetical protein